MDVEKALSGKYTAYPDYKDSAGFEWFGLVPEQWTASRLKFETSINMGQSPSSDDCNLDGFGLPFLQGNAEFGVCSPSPKQYCDVARKVANKGDLLFSVRAPVGALNLADQDYGIGRGLCAISTNDGLTRGYLWWLMSIVKAELDSISTGSTFEAVSAEQVENVFICKPTNSEQQTIANFLDHETAKIDTLIDKQQQLITLLKEKRQAVISHAVTKGLKPNAPMRDSGVEWLGEVPAHWEVTRAKFVSNIFVPQRNKPDLNDLTGIAWATMEDMKNHYVNSTKHFVSFDASKVAGSKTLKAGSVIASCVGNFGVTAINKVDVIINQQLQAFVPTGIKSEYLREIVSISTVYFEFIGTAATLVYVNQQGFENLPVLVPSEGEQNDICAFVDKECDKFDKLMQLCETTTHLLKERRTALISAAVTGKIDVRNWIAPTTTNNKEVSA